MNSSNFTFIHSLKFYPVGSKIFRVNSFKFQSKIHSNNIQIMTEIHNKQVLLFKLSILAQLNFWPILALSPEAIKNEAKSKSKKYFENLG